MDQVELLDLIARINTGDEHIADSRESTSWKALRETEELTDPGLFPPLQGIITANEGRKKEQREIRSAAYFIYGRLMEKAYLPEAVPFYIQRLTVESDKYVLSSLLDRVSDWGRKNLLLPAELDLSPVLALTVEERRSVRHDAVRALSACPGEASRKACAYYLEQKDEKAYQYEIYYANIAFQTIGEPPDIPLLERFLKSRRPDLKLTAQYAIQYIRERVGMRDKPRETAR